MESGISSLAARWILEYRPWRRGGFWNIALAARWILEYRPWQRDGIWNIAPGNEMDSGKSPLADRWILEPHPTPPHPSSSLIDCGGTATPAPTPILGLASRDAQQPIDLDG